MTKHVLKYITHNLAKGYGAGKIVCLEFPIGYRLHRHVFTEIMLGISGKATHIVNDQYMTIEAGSFTYMRPGTQHQILPIAGEQPIIAYTLSFDSAEYAAALWSHLHSHMSQSFFNVKLDDKLFAVARAVFFRLLQMRKTNNPYLPDSFTGSDEIGVVALSALDLSLRQQEAAPNEMNSTLSYILNNYTYPIYLSDIADMVHYSPYHLSRMFRSRLGQTFQRYLLELRLNLSADILLQSEFGLNQVSKLAGFNSESWFKHAFVNYFNLPPSKICDKHLQNVRSIDPTHASLALYSEES
ncbi:MAG: AraC family transcriptional regulator [Clostridiaceae bacterium]|mgnify:CR=1 FL=1|nr:AraC family transcriptional regulator [Clostridiaceae bacterium]